MRPLRDGEVIKQFPSLLSPVYVRKRFTTDEAKSGNIGGHTAAIGPIGIGVIERTPGILEAELVDLIVADGPGVLAQDAPIVEVVDGSTRPRILSEVLWSLCIHLHAGGAERIYAATQHELLVVGEFVVQSQRVDTAQFIDREITQY